MTAPTTLPVTVAAWATRLIAAAEAPAPFSSRDGKLLRLVPPDRRLAPEDVQRHLTNALAQEPRLAATLVAAAAAAGRCASAAGGAVAADASGTQQPHQLPRRLRERRHLAAALRGWAYLEAGQADVALQDARCALATAPGREAAAAAGGSGDSAPAVDGLSQQQLEGLLACRWAPAHTLAAASYAARSEWTQAALHAEIARSLNPNEPAHIRRLATITPYLLPTHAAALASGGALGLVRQLAAEAEARIPEFLRPQPKWHFFNAWMRSRIAALYPGGLPEPVVLKMLGQDAGELDFRVSHPAALQDQVSELLEVFEAGGPAALEAHSPSPLAWSRVQELAGPEGAVGLPIGYRAPPPSALTMGGGGAAQLAGPQQGTQLSTSGA